MFIYLYVDKYADKKPWQSTAHGTVLHEDALMMLVGAYRAIKLFEHAMKVVERIIDRAVRKSR